ncbi:hypothetical protein LPJ53_004904 [Coemansia erecta]|uniref:Mid2 domain-containing protein n=1 Tax=Coemansia erecta TaxID=147472 RepID=A0A9W7XY11_9FUNG|nr:hypothetical protein LPJ53_004904 [Coemansia erecta]
MATSTTVADCSAQRYCTQTGVALGYQNQLVVHWNNQYPPLNPESLVTVSVYSSYDLSTPIYQQTGIDNTNGAVTLKPDAAWFARYTGNDDATGEDQQIYFAAYLQGNDPPAVSDMLSLQLTATPQQYREIQQILHPELFATTSTSSSPSSTPSSSSTSPETATTQTSLSSSAAAASASTATATVTHTSTPTVADAHARSGLSAGAIAGIAVGGAIGLLLLLLIVLFPLYRRRQRQRRMLSKSAEMAAASSPSPDTPPTGEAAALAATGAAALAAAGEKHPRTSSPTDTPLLVGGKPNNSFTSHDGSLADSHMSPSTVYQPLSLESPRILMNMPSSTRSASAIAGRPDGDHGPPPPLVGRSPDPILSSDDARQIGDIFRDALRKPPASEEDASEDPSRDTMLLRDLDDELGEEEDPGWRERVASERMQRELEQEASVIRSVAMRAHGSDYSSSRPETSRSETSRNLP